MKKYLSALTVLLLFTAPAFAASEVIIKTEDGWEISALYKAPKEENKKTAVLLHDLGKNKEVFNKFEQKLSDQDFGYLSIDLRGHGKSTNLEVQKNFSKTGTDNEFNQMVRDITAAISYLNRHGVETEDIYLIGAGLGANVAAKSLIFNPNIAGIALLTPTLKTRDVLTMQGIKINTKPVFIAVSSEDRKQMMEASFIRNAAYLSSGQGKVTFMTAYDLKGIEMVDKYLSEELLQWLHAPELPRVEHDGDVIISDEAIYLEPPSALL
jgi:dienelactone hydrolase